MITVDSRKTTIRHDAPIYVTSEPQDSRWGQPSASQYVFTVIGNRLIGEPIAGVYLPTQSSETLTLDAALVEELAAWDALSDEALANFEASLE